MAMAQIIPSSPPAMTRKINKIPIDRDRVRRNSEFFGRDFLQESPFIKGGKIVYTLKKTNFTLDYRFDKMKSEQLKEILRLDKEGNVFSLGRRALRLWYSLIVLAAEQGQGTSGTFHIRDIVRLWESKRSGRLYSDIKQTFLSLATFNPYYHNNKQGEDRIEWGHSFFDAWLIKGTGDNAVFEFELNKVALGITAKWLNKRELSFEEIGRGYLTLEVKELKKPRPDAKYENFIECLRLLKPGQVNVKFETVMSNWIKIGDDMLRQRKKCHDLVLKYLSQARAEEEIQGFILKVTVVKNWLKEWRVQITK
jgi:hypothetical protein